MKYTIQETNFIDWYTSGGSDDPKTVITQWFAAGRKNPTCVAISAISAATSWSSNRKTQSQGLLYQLMI